MGTLKEQIAVQETNMRAMGETVDSVVTAVHKLDEAISQSDEKMSALAGSVEETNAKLGSILEIIMRNQHSMDPAEHDKNEYGMVELVTGASGEAEVVRSQYADVDSPEFRQKADREAFLHEMVEIEIQDSPDRQADPRFGVWVNGKPFVFHRGERRKVPRFVVETLARARPVHYGNEEYMNDKAERAVRNPTRRGLRYPFAVIQDSERGREWLRGIASQP